MFDRIKPHSIDYIYYALLRYVFIDWSNCWIKRKCFLTRFCEDASAVDTLLQSTVKVEIFTFSTEITIFPNHMRASAFLNHSRKKILNWKRQSFFSFVYERKMVKWAQLPAFNAHKNQNFQSFKLTAQQCSIGSLIKSN